MAFDPIQEDCHRLVLEALRRDNIPLTDAAAVEHLMEQFTRNPAPLIVHDRDRAGHLIAKVVEAVDYRIPFIPDDTQAEQEEAAAENMLREAAALDPTNWDAQRMLPPSPPAPTRSTYSIWYPSAMKSSTTWHSRSPRRRTPTSARPQAT